MNKIDYDLVIIGGGPAGMTSAIYAARAGLNTLMVEKMAPGGQVLVTDLVENYPGFPEGITGADLAEKIANHVRHFDIKTEYDEVISLDLSQPVKTINFNNKSITTHAVIIATGASPRALGVPGEKKFFGKGVSVCATCDGPFFKDKVVAAVGGGNTAVQESIFLTKFAKKVYLIHRRNELRAVKVLQERAFANDKIEILWDSVLTGIEGLFNVENISVKNVKTNKEKSIKADGCFIWIGIKPNTEFLKDNILELDDYGFIKADIKMHTSVSGVFAAGDVRDTYLRQITTAVGDGAMAAMAAVHYIDNI